MAQHDRYDTDVLKALQKIANSLSGIERYLKSKAEESNNDDKEVNNDGRV